MSKFYSFFMFKLIFVIQNAIIASISPIRRFWSNTSFVFIKAGIVDMVNPSIAKYVYPQYLFNSLVIILDKMNPPTRNPIIIGNSIVIFIVLMAFMQTPYMPIIDSSTVDEIPGIMVELAIRIPVANKRIQFLIFISMLYMVVLLLQNSNIIPMEKVIKNSIRYLSLNPFLVDSCINEGIVPKISPTNTSDVMVGYLFRKQNITLLNRYVPTAIPVAIGNRNVMLFLKSLKRLLIASKHLSYSPKTIKNEEPLTPGKMLNIPTSMLFKKLFIVNYICSFKKNTYW